MSSFFKNILADQLKYLFLFLCVISSEIVPAQFVITKFTDSGSIKKYPVSTSEEECPYERGDEVQINDFLNDDWFHVTTKKCHGYVISRHIQFTDEVRRGLDNLELIEKREDSINKVTLSSYGYDIYDPKEIRKNIVRYASDSLLIIWQDLPTKVKRKPKARAKSKSVLLTDADIAILDFVDGYYKLAANNIEYYITPKHLKEPYFDFSDQLDHVLELRNAKELIAQEEENRRYLAEQLKKEQYYVSKWGWVIYEKVKMGQYWVGMTEEMAKVGGLYPGMLHVNEMVTVYGKREQWECRNGVSLYFESGILKAFEVGNSQQRQVVID